MEPWGLFALQAICSWIGPVKFKVSIICATTWQKPMFKKRISQQSAGPSLEKNQTTSLSQNHSQAMKLRNELIFKSNVLGATVRTGDWCNPSYPKHWLLSSSLQHGKNQCSKNASVSKAQGPVLKKIKQPLFHKTILRQWNSGMNWSLSQTS